MNDQQRPLLEFKREVLARHGDRPTAERREIAIDLREDWPRALKENGFDATNPSAWIAEGLLIYLPATAQYQLFTGIHELAAPGSHVAVEEGVPMPDEEFQAKVEETRTADDSRGGWFQLVYNEQHAPAAQWFGERGWTAVATPLSDYLRSLGRPVPAPNSESGQMVSSINEVEAA